MCICDTFTLYKAYSIGDILSLILQSVGQCLQGAELHQVSHRPELNLLSLDEREGHQGQACHSGFHQQYPDGTLRAPGG